MSFVAATAEMSSSDELIVTIMRVDGLHWCACEKLANERDHGCIPFCMRLFSFVGSVERTIAHQRSRVK